MGERRPVEMVRLEQPEEVYEVEAVFGRDASSVFPNMNKDDDPMEALKASIGAKRFVSESELEDMKKARGLSVDDGTAAADKPLAEVLAERKKAKQDAFDDQWKQMKTGKNRPLEPDELEFLEALAHREAQEQARLRSQEDADLAAYRAAVAAAADAKAPAAAAAAEAEAGDDASLLPGPSGRADDAAAEPIAPLLGSSGSGGLQSQMGQAGRKPPSSRQGSKQVLPVLRPLVKVKPKGAAAEGAAPAAAAAAAEQQRDSKRARLAADSSAQQQEADGQAAGGGGLAGLLGDYTSDSE